MSGKSSTALKINRHLDRVRVGINTKYKEIADRDCCVTTKKVKSAFLGLEVYQILQISKRTLQRYRNSGTLPSHLVYHKTWYKESKVVAFTKTHFTENLARRRERKKRDWIK